MAVIVDTNFFLSLVHPKDPNANKAQKILTDLSDGSFGLLYTSNYVVAESCTLVAVRTRNNLQTLNHLANLFWGNKKIAIEIWSNQEIDTKT